MKRIFASVGLGLVVGCVFGSAQASAAVYVVDQAAPNASDANTGTEDQPLKNIEHAATLVKPGDTVFVMAGIYNRRVKLTTSGSAGNPITFQAMPRHSALVAGFDVEASYLRIQGFEITAAKPSTAVQLSGSHCEVLDNDIHDMMVGVAGTGGKPGKDGEEKDYSEVSDNRIVYNRVYHSQYGFMLSGNNWLVENNEVNRLFMYTPGNKYDDCDYSRFFGKGCVERYNYFHGSTASEIRVAHVDCLQTFTVNGDLAQDLLFDSNTCFDFHQLCMVESAPHIGNVSNWTLRRNIVSANSPTMSGGWGPDIIQTLNVTLDHNTISTVRWSTIGLRGKESTHAQIRNNLLCNAERAVIDGDETFSASNPVMQNNLTFKTAPLSGPNINGQDPRFVDADSRNFRLKHGSPAVGAGEGGTTIGALEYPNVYYVDPRHPAASDNPSWGYPAVPLATLSNACAIAKSGETVVLRGGVYRETLQPLENGVTFRAMAGETVTLSGADVIAGWKRRADGSWTAPMESTPTKVLRDGRPWTQFTFDPAAKLMIVTNGDPRLHLFESVVRAQGIQLSGRTGVKIQGIEVVNTLH